MEHDKSFISFLESFRPEVRRALLILICSIVVLAEVPSLAPVMAHECSASLLEKPWVLEAQSDSSEAYQDIEKSSLQGMDNLQVTLDLHGAMLLEDDDAASIIIDDNGDWYVANMIREGKAANGMDGEQTITIPLSDFIGLGKNKDVSPNFQDGVDGTIHIRLWSANPYTVEIKDIHAVCGHENQTAAVSATPVPTEIPLVPTLQYEVNTSPDGKKVLTIRSVDTMKLSKDRVCDQPSDAEIATIVSAAKDMGANYIAIETPYDNPSCANAVAYTARWVKAIRSKGLFVWHRHMSLQFEGIYDQPIVNRTKGEKIPKALQKDAVKITSVPYERLDQYLVQMYAYILKNKSFFEPGDIFTPSPEPDSRGVNGINGSTSTNQFSSKEDFNQWLIDANTIATEAFSKAKIDGVKIGYWGFSGFTAAGLDNADWEGKSFLECETIASGTDMNLAVDHYPDDSHSMQEDLAQLTATMKILCPDLDIHYVLGEFGSDDENKVTQALQAVDANKFDGINYWSTHDIQFLDNGKPNSLYTILRNFYSRN